MYPTTQSVQIFWVSTQKTHRVLAVFRIWIRKFLGLLEPELLVRVMDPDPDPSIIKQKIVRKPEFLLFFDFFVTFYL